MSPDPNHSDQATMVKIDQQTVEELELMAPRASCEDAMTVHGLMVSG
jgi:hypothetical protein